MKRSKHLLVERALIRFGAWMEKRGSMSRIKRLEDGLETPYLDRYFIFRTGLVSKFLHRYWASDEEGVHCHPWANISIPLVNGFWEHHHDGTRTFRRPWRPVFRSARELHRIVLEPGTEGRVWSLFIKFRRVREWGFADELKFRPIKAYSATSGNAWKKESVFFPITGEWNEPAA